MGPQSTEAPTYQKHVGGFMAAQTICSTLQSRLFTGIGAFGVARLFEVMVPALTAVAINKMASGDFEITLQVFGIIGAVIARYCVVTFARFNVRKVR